ncbi:MAG TPA: nicotinate phosphoribosyltransferase [Rhodanobacteraceae bacterium]|nr:nicotinate phosphoribosyltransferase [Rhodanobacteraceae bacterium]
MRIDTSGTYTDLYQIAMGQALFRQTQHERPAVFDYFFRRLPFGGGYALFAGLETVLDALAEWRFSADEVDHLATLGFDRDYLDYLGRLRFRADIHAPREGEVVFPTEPLLRIEGRVLEVQLVETLILNLLNFQTLIATKAARMRQAAGDAVLSEFGLRRAQAQGGVLAARAAVIGGCDSTSDVYAAERFGLRAEGTMAHAFIQWHGDELSAFRAFAAARPEHTVLLVDTYDTLHSGIPNAITVATEMRARGQQLRAIRLDSGDLAYLARRARAMLDAAGFPEVRIAASNQLDEYLIRSLRQQGAPIDIFGVGTSLVTGQPDAALDGVYKLAMADGEARIKLSENLAKTTLPGRKQVHRYFDADGHFAGIDGIARLDEAPPSRLIHPFEPHQSMRCPQLASEPLLRPVLRAGERVGAARDVAKIKAFAATRLALLPPEFQRFENPHAYKIGISEALHRERDTLRQRFHAAGTQT